MWIYHFFTVVIFRYWPKREKREVPVPRWRLPPRLSRYDTLRDYYNFVSVSVFLVSGA